MNGITNVQAAYIAGIFDAEGDIGLGRVIKYNIINYKLMYRVTNNDLKLLEWLKNITGIGIIHNKIRYKNTHKPGYYWQLRTNETKELLPIIDYYLIGKEDQNYWLQDFINGMRKATRRNPLTYDEKCEKDFIYRQLAELNKKGSKENQEEINFNFQNCYKVLSECQLSYIAGCFEGDGVFCINKDVYNHITVTVNIENTNTKLLNWLQFTTGLGRISLRREATDKCAAAYVWFLKYHEMIYLIPKIIQYFIIKRKQAENVLKCLNSNNIIEKENLFQESRILNKRGI